jgi:UDP-N-acetylmuramoylalanine--D-glutamate ligase
MNKKNDNLIGKKVLVLGLGLSGRAASRLLLNKGAKVIGIDNDITSLEQNSELGLMRQEGMHIYPENVKLSMDSVDLVVASPGVPPSNFLYQEAVKKKLEIIGEIELACRYITQSFLGITGTNGKTTVTALVGHILNFSGKSALIAGNIGIPLTKELSNLNNQIIVCELSSYQLETMQTQVIDAAVILNVSPDHLDRYRNMEEYATAKFRIAACLKPKGNLYIENSCYENFGYLLKNLKPKTYGYGTSCTVRTDLHTIFWNEAKRYALPLSLRYKRSHDLENLMAAFILCQEIGIEIETFDQALSTFKKPPHRIEFVRKLGGVSYYDDSKGTNIDAVIRAVESITGNVILIAGGLDKGAGYTPWISAFENKVKAIFAIGQAKEKMYNELSCQFPVEKCQSLEEAIVFSGSVAQEGDNILLSPGCASFDMFQNYAHRGTEFKRIVHNLGKGEIK